MRKAFGSTLNMCSSGKEAYEELVKVYSKLYLPEQMGELCRFAEIISRELKDKATLEKH